MSLDGFARAPPQPAHGALAAGAPSPHSPASVSRQASIAALPFSSTAGNCGSISINFLSSEMLGTPGCAERT